MVKIAAFAAILASLALPVHAEQSVAMAAQKATALLNLGQAALTDPSSPPSVSQLLQVGANALESVNPPYLPAASPGVSSISIADNGNCGAPEAGAVSIDEALNAVVASRSTVGLIQNRQEYVMANLTTVATYLAVAKARIVDTDYAAETAALAKYNVLAQAGSVMLAQANAQPQSVLQLLQD